MTRPTVITAAYVAPMDQPMIPDGAIALSDDQIVAVGRRTEIMARYSMTAEVIEAGNAIILPGLVNAHTHLELSACQCGESPGGNFTDWILSIPTRLAAVCEDREQAFIHGVNEGIAQCLRFGVTTVGDISQQFHLTRPILRNSPLRVVSYGETLGLGGARPRFAILLEGAVAMHQATDRLRIGLTPHAPYTVDQRGYEQCLAIAHHRKLPLATHLAETPEETEFLLYQRGIFRDIWDKLSQWQDPVPLLAQPPVPMAASLGMLNYPTLLAHVNYCDDNDLALLAQGQASVVWCPRTHRYFGHPPHRWRDMLQAGINVAVGTDSCASSPDLNLLDDLRLIRHQTPEVPPHTLFEMVTSRAAAALQWSHQIGSLTPGKSADLSIFPVKTTAPLAELLDQPIVPSQVWIAGRIVHQNTP